MTHTILRRATLSDATDITRLINAAYAPFRDTIPDLPDVAAGIVEDIANHVVWVAEDTTVIGCLIAHVGSTDLHIANLAVHPDAGGQRIGRKLMTHAEEFAKAQNLTKLRLATHPKMPRNVAFYERLGWSVTDTTPRKIMMAKRL